MKKIFLAVAAMAMLATACTKDDAVSGGTESLVSFTVNSPELQTRYGEGDEAKVLHYAFYNEDGILEAISAITDEKAVTLDANRKATIQVPLVEGRTYSAIFWASAPDAADVYTVDWNAKTVEMATNLTANDESYDAFYNYTIGIDPAKKTHKIELRRPFAQINIATADKDAASSAGFDALATKVTVNAYKKLEFTVKEIDGVNTGVAEVAGEMVPFTYGWAANATGTATVGGKDYAMLSMNYVLVNARELVDVKMEVSEDADNFTAPIERNYTTVPVQRNYRTYIVGNLLTTQNEFNVTTVPGFNDIILPETTEEKLVLAAQIGGEFTLTEDVVLKSALVVSSDFVLNLNGNTITGPNVAKDTDGNKVHVIVNNANLTIKNGTIKSVAENGGSAINNYGTLTIEDATIEGAPSNTASGTASYAVNTSGADSKLTVKSSNISGRGAIGATNGTKVEINGGTYHTPEIAWGHAVYADGEGTEVVINDGTFSEGYAMGADNWGMYQIYSGNKAKVVVYGGTFEAWDCANGYDLCTATEGVITIYGGKFADNPSNQNGKNYVAEGYYVNKVGDDYVVNDYILTADTEGLQAALDAAKDGEIIHLTAGVAYDVVYLGRSTKSNNTAMYCETHDFTTTDAAAFAAHLAEAGYHTTPQYTTTLKNLTIVGTEGATVAGVVATAGHAYGDVYDYVLDKDYDSGSAYYKTLHLENIKFQNVAFTGKIDINTSDAESTYNGVTFEGCTFTTGGTASTNGPAIRYYNEANNGKVQNIVVKDCEFNNCYQGVYVHHVNGVTVTDNVFNATGHNAVALQGHDGNVDLKNVVIENNTFNNIGDRVIRFNNVGADSNITIQHNTATNSGDAAGEVIKATSIAAGVTTNVGYNNWNGGVVVNPELRDTTIEVSTSDAIKGILATEADGVTIVLAAGTYEGLSFTNPANFKAKNVTIVGQENVEVAGFSVNGWSATDNIVVDGLTFKNITFSKGLLLSTKFMANVVVEECDFVNDACVHQNDKTESLTNLEIKNCTFTGDMSGNTTAIMLENTNNVTVEGCGFTNIDYNVMQAGILTGTVLFDNNTVNGTGDRVFRFVDTSSVDITISNNTIVSNGDGNGELAKASNAVEITLTNNTWNGKTDAEVADKLINITAK